MVAHPPSNAAPRARDRGRTYVPGGALNTRAVSAAVSSSWPPRAYQRIIDMFGCSHRHFPEALLTARMWAQVAPKCHFEHHQRAVALKPPFKCLLCFRHVLWSVYGKGAASTFGRRAKLNRRTHYHTP